MTPPEDPSPDLAAQALAILAALKPETLDVDQRLRYASALATLALHNQVVELTRYVGRSRAEERRDAAARRFTVERE